VLLDKVDLPVFNSKGVWFEISRDKA